VSIYALVSPGGSPGVTTTALALTLTWSRPVILAECDPSGGDIVAGLFAGHLQAPRGLLDVAYEAGRGSVALLAGTGGQLAALDAAGSRSFLAGLSDPRQAAGLTPAWPAIAAALANAVRAGRSCDVIADCGRIDSREGQPSTVLAEAAVVAMVMRPILRQISAAAPRLEILADLLNGLERVGLLLVGDKGSHTPAQITRTLGVRLLAKIPSDVRTAAVLSDGHGRRTSLDDTPLLRAARTAIQAIIGAGSARADPNFASANGLPG
jgi:hypothetical protein